MRRIRPRPHEAPSIGTLLWGSGAPCLLSTHPLWRDLPECPLDRKFKRRAGIGICLQLRLNLESGFGSQKVRFSGWGEFKEGLGPWIKGADLRPSSF